MKRNTKRILILLLTAALVLGMMPAAAFGEEAPEAVGAGDSVRPAAFQDVTGSDWFYGPVKEMTEEGLMNGVADGVFDPQGTATRGMLVTVIWRMAGCVKPSHSAVCRFSDVTEDWNKTAIMWMTDGGSGDTITGFSDGTFRPNKTLTRAEAAKIIGFDALSRDSENNPAALEAKDFADQKQIPEWAVRWVKICQEKGILSGYSDGTFRPDQTITRAEMAKMLTVLKSLDWHHIQPAPVKYFPNEKTDALIEAVAGEGTENYLFSPLSLKVAFALAANGAKGDTRDEILNSLGIRDLEIFNHYIRGMKEDFRKASDVVTIDLNNSIWVNEDQMRGADFKEEYKDLLAQYYTAEAGKVNNANAVPTINGWISEKTRGKIPKVLDSSDFSTALVNTLYFKGSWKMPFNKAATRKGDFTQADGSKVQTDLMHMTETIQYYQKGDVKMIRLPYENLARDEDGNRKGDGPFATVSMYVVLSDGPVELANLIDEARDKMTYQKVAVTLPKFSFRSKFELNDALQQLGIRKAFTDAADFSDMSEIPQCISDVLQSTFIEVNEEGTEAAAATVIVNKSTTALDPTVPIPFTADRPFRFAIVDDGKEVLFAGAYNYVQ